MSDHNLTLTLHDGRTEFCLQGDYAERTRDLPLSESPPLAVIEPGSTVALELRDNLAGLKDEWKAFERTADCTVFQSFDWLAKWQQHIGTPRGTLPAIVVGRDACGEILFILPLAIETHGPVRRLTWLGSELCDYNAPLLAPHFSSRIRDFTVAWNDILRLLRTDARSRFDFVDLQKMAETVGSQHNPFLSLDVLANASSAHVATLGSNWDEFYKAKRSSQTRKKERKQLKHLAEIGEVRFIDLEDANEIARTLETLMVQKSRTFARMGVEDLFARPGYRAFYLDVTTDPEARALIHVSRLDVGTTIAAANLGLSFRGCYYLVLSSYDDGEVMRFGPGRAHLHELLRHAMERGYRTFDFTIGDEPYKRDWADIVVRLYDHLHAVTLRGAIVVAAMKAFRRTKRLIKQTPVLWHAYSKARTLGRFPARR